MTKAKRPHKKKPLLERLSTLLRYEPKNKEQVVKLLRRAKERNIVTGEVLEMIERILHVSEMQVREVMVPKAQMVVIQKDSQLNDILPIVIESGHSRFPVVDPNEKDICGILLAKDLLIYGFQRTPDQFDLRSIIRPTVFVPQSKRLEILLREFRLNRNHIAMVLDEYGHVAGLVTIEDVLEEIVGEIEDEYDIEEENGHIKKLDNGSYHVKASTLIAEFNEYFNAHFSDDEFDTIGGIVLKSFGHLPKRGESTKIQSFRFKVLQSDNRRLDLLEVQPAKRK